MDRKTSNSKYVRRIYMRKMFVLDTSYSYKPTSYVLQPVDKECMGKVDATSNHNRFNSCSIRNKIALDMARLDFSHNFKMDDDNTHGYNINPWSHTATAVRSRNKPVLDLIPDNVNLVILPAVVSSSNIPPLKKGTGTKGPETSLLFISILRKLSKHRTSEAVLIVRHSSRFERNRELARYYNPIREPCSLICGCGKFPTTRPSPARIKEQARGDY